MSNKLEILLLGRSIKLTGQVEVLLKKHTDYNVSALVNNNAKKNPLTGLSTMPELIILAISDAWQEELNELADMPAHKRSPVLIIGSNNQIEAMRMAMRIGAKDFLNTPVDEQELLEAIKRIQNERAQSGSQHLPEITVVMNAKGGSGATMLACNIAAIMSKHLKSRTTLVDLDFQFGTLPLYFDMMPKHSILDAIEIIGSLDPIGLDGFMMSHSSGLRILASKPDKVVLPDEVSVDQLKLLLDILVQDNEQIVIDVPRQIDHITSTILERADRIIIVAQQSLTHIRDVVRLLGILKEELLIPEDRILLVVNRYNKSSVVSLDDIKKTIHTDPALLIPNDYKNVDQSENIGIPLYEYARNSAITETLVKFTENILGKYSRDKKNILSRVISNLKWSA